MSLLRKELEEVRNAHEETIRDAQKKIVNLQAASKKEDWEQGQKALVSLLHLQSQTASQTRQL